MCSDPPGQRLQRFAVCTCGASFPECDKGDAIAHARAPGASNHEWTFNLWSDLDDRKVPR